MSETFDRVRALVACGEYFVSRHGLRELANNALSLAELISTLDAARVVEDYPDYWKGSSVLVLAREPDGRPVHVLWGVRRGTSTPAVLVTAYRPEVGRWSEDFLTRRG